MPDALAYNLNFLHPLLMWALLGLASYGMFLGIKTKRTRTATPEARKGLIKGHFARRHFQIGSLILVVMVLGTFGGMAVTYLNNDKLFVSPHLLVGITMTCMVAIAAALTPLIQHGNLIARKVHVGLNMGLMTFFLWQAVTGMQIVAKIWEDRPV